MIGSRFLEALGAGGSAPDRGGKMDLYGRFVGSWDLDVVQFPENGASRRRKGEWHFGWALEGRAVQDVWIVPPRGELRLGDAAANTNSYGTTLRVFDPRIDAWWSVDRPGHPELPAHDRPRARRRHRATRHDRRRPADPLVFFGDHIGLLLVAGRELERRRSELARRHRIHGQADRIVPARTVSMPLTM
jgi:hypothetical protein